MEFLQRKTVKDLRWKKQHFCSHWETKMKREDHCWHGGGRSVYGKRCLGCLGWCQGSLAGGDWIRLHLPCESFYILCVIRRKGWDQRWLLRPVRGRRRRLSGAEGRTTMCPSANHEAKSHTAFSHSLFTDWVVGRKMRLDGWSSEVNHPWSGFKLSTSVCCLGYLPLVCPCVCSQRPRLNRRTPLYILSESKQTRIIAS